MRGSGTVGTVLLVSMGAISGWIAGVRWDNSPSCQSILDTDDWEYDTTTEDGQT